MIYVNTQKNVDYSPRKMRVVADMVRKMTPYQAVEILGFTNRAGAVHLMKAIKTAMANAGNTEGLSFKSIEINEGLKLKRYRVGTAGRGRGRPYRRRYSHIKIVLSDETMPEKVVKAEKPVKDITEDKNVKEKKGEVEAVNEQTEQSE